MAITKTSQTQLGSVTNLASGSSLITDSNPYDVSDAIACEIEVIISASATPDPDKGSVDIEIYESQDGTNFGDDPIFTGTTLPDQTSWRAHFPVNVIASKTIIVKVTNNLKDSSENGVSADITVKAIRTTT